MANVFQFWSFWSLPPETSLRKSWPWGAEKLKHLHKYGGNSKLLLEPRSPMSLACVAGKDGMLAGSAAL